jgi:hypothetical protein
LVKPAAMAAGNVSVNVIVHGGIMHFLQNDFVHFLNKMNFLFFGISRPIGPENSPFMAAFSHIAGFPLFHFGTK